ncbi:20S PROTEASOME BETA-TYPE SUBUNIT COMPONENT PRE2 [Encephalitozoon cuniculi GB-M1]|uniref:Proteasome subunit beta n=2 Tax=Encephalitozoon cuniculi TaxID=6035 RepID=Q8SR88_ENCCU|nr:proteasome core particle subunit beta 5 [Encephalitozoon cuniculi GB-M1]AGE95123.1 20S proteasome beta-type subunit component PRE2 [Encephalitozoon cuniculi]KMV65711.1 type-5 proteasome subunit beta [Encephalitozoon cuniculi EcunIII-L]UYI27117.1 proteasome subunit beta type-5 [Encephalitozoon cuniculi]CAD26490.1 20S PROTEASOME BETA-TYPE SUBUNIT COMPONENT PRE2 [Encephalitozoon cuniculi GB-M1]
MEETLRRDIRKIDATCVDQETIRSLIKPYHGTTTLAFIFKEGMVIAVDSRATSGSYIASQTVNKVININKNLLGTMAGGAADCLFWENLMGLYAKNYELTNGRRITVAAASMYLSNCVYRYKGYGLSMGTMICGYDSSGPSIYYVDDDGKRVSGSLFSVGSGSTIAYGILSSSYRFDMDKDEALNLGRDAIFHAAHRDAFSGGLINLYYMNEDGWTKVGSYDVNEFDKE